jgi:hypothetical protein
MITPEQFLTVARSANRKRPVSPALFHPSLMPRL